ncbi:MAG: HAD-IA family hydrolase, partial [Candidatus Gracilibacteria bacterium]|nr:HAD-IA family hydrolase [Candidatus Gracilibacteria bacterium]
EFFTTKLEKDYGIPLGKTLVFFKGVFQDCLVGKKDLKEELERVLSYWGWTDGVEALLEFWFENENVPNQELLSVIKELKEKGYAFFLATNNEKYRVNFISENMGFGRIFDQIFNSAAIGHKKPEREFYEFVCDELSKLGFSKEDILFFDDDEENVVGAIKFGIESVLYYGIKSFNDKIGTILEF